jgi:hypothetical protein
VFRFLHFVTLKASNAPKNELLFDINKQEDIMFFTKNPYISFSNILKYSLKFTDMTGIQGKTVPKIGIKGYPASIFLISKPEILFPKCHTHSNERLLFSTDTVTGGRGDHRHHRGWGGGSYRRSYFNNLEFLLRFLIGI